MIITKIVRYLNKKAEFHKIPSIKVTLLCVRQKKFNKKMVKYNLQFKQF